MRVLVTGGAGFIGHHLVNYLLSNHHQVIVLDNLDPQVHRQWMNNQGEIDWPAYMPEHPDLTLIFGDVRNRASIRGALLLDGEVDAVVHLAAKVGVGQGQYAIRDYYATNVLGTASLLEEIAALEKKPRLFVAGSMSAYGEGNYRDERTLEIMPRPAARDPRLIVDGDFEPWPDRVRPVGISETCELHPSGFYAATKAEQERMALLFGKIYQIPVWVGRFFNCYGPGQALGNPYTGVVAIFANQILSGESPLIYEDGRQSRDFIHVNDVAAAIYQMVVNAPAESAGVYNVGTGSATSILQLAEELLTISGSSLKPEITRKYRSGDIRHCFANIKKIRNRLNWHPQIDLKTGLQQTWNWIAAQSSQAGLLRAAQQELESRGLIS